MNSAAAPTRRPPLWLGQRLDPPSWGGPRLARYVCAPSAAFVPLTVPRDTLFVWRGARSAVDVRWQGRSLRCQRGDGVLDLLSVDDEAYLASAEACECVLVDIDASAAESHAGAPRHLLTAFGLRDVLLSQLASSLVDHCLDGEPLGADYTAAFSAALMAHVRARYTAAAPAAAPPPQPGQARGRLTAEQQRRLVRHVERHLDRPLPVPELAALAGYSPAHFVRLFQRSFGCSPHQFVLALRIDEAKRLLRDERCSLADIAAACGFADQSHFGAAFVRRCGMPPGRYRAGSAGSTAPR